MSWVRIIIVNILIIVACLNVVGYNECNSLCLNFSVLFTELYIRVAYSCFHINTLFKLRFFALFHKIKFLMNLMIKVSVFDN
jgi:hypothetical protein